MVDTASDVIVEDELLSSENNVSFEEFDSEVGKLHSSRVDVSLDEIASKLLRDKFILTALELHTELAEHGRELPRLRDFFSNPGNFERQGDYYSSRSELSPGLPRTASIQTFDSLDFARYSDDGDRQVDEKVAVLEFELRKARETIKSLRANLTEAAESEVTTPDNHFDNFVSDDPIKPHEMRALNFLVNEHLLRHNYKLTSITFSDENEEQDFDDWDDVGLNIPKPPPLLHLYRDHGRHLNFGVVSIDRSVQVDCRFVADSNTKLNVESVCEETEGMSMLLDGEDVIFPDPFQSSAEEVERIPVCVTTTSEATCSTPCNTSTDIRNSFICSVCGQNRSMVETKDPVPSSFRLRFDTLQEDDSSFVLKNDSDENELDSVSESVSLAPTLDFVVDSVTTRLSAWDFVSNSTNEVCKRNVPPLFYRTLVELCRTRNKVPLDSRLTNEVSKVADTNEKVVLMLARCLPHIVPNVILAKREELIPVILCTISLHPDPSERDRLLNILFNLIKRPDDEQRLMILNGFVAIAKCVGSTRIESELLPQCWEQINHKYLERRLLVAEACGILIPYIPNEIRSSLVWSMLQQMLMDDKSDLVRESVVKSLSLLVTCIEDVDKYSQGMQLLVYAVCDSSERVFEAALQFLVPSFAIWAKDADRLESELFTGLLSIVTERISALPAPPTYKSSSLPIDTSEQRVIRLIDALLQLLPWLFVSLLETLPNSESDLHGDARLVDVGRFPRNISPLSDVSIIVGDEKKAVTLVKNYEAYISEEWYETWPKFDWITKFMLPKVVELSCNLDLTCQPVIHSLCQFFYWFCRIFGRSFTTTKIKPVFREMLRMLDEDSDANFGKNVITKSLVPVYAAGVIAAFNQEEDRRLLHQFLYKSTVTVSLCHLPLDSVEAAIGELRFNESNHDVLLAYLWDIVVHTSAFVRCTAAKLFCLLVGTVNDSLLSTKVVPALVTLASDPEISVRISTVPTFGAILQSTTIRDPLDKSQMQLQTFLDDPLYKDQHSLHVEIIRTFGKIASNSEPRFRDEFVLPHLVALASHNNHRANEAKRLELAVVLLEAFTAISCCFISEQVISDLLLPGLRCLLFDVQQLAPEHELVVVGMIHEFESKIEIIRPQDRSGSLSGTGSAAAASIEDVRNRVSKIFTARTPGKTNIQSIFQLRKK